MTDDRDADGADTEQTDPACAVPPHLENLEDGCGCAEVWEHLSEQRDTGAD